MQSSGGDMERESKRMSISQPVKMRGREGELKKEKKNRETQKSAD